MPKPRYGRKQLQAQVTLPIYDEALDDDIDTECIVRGWVEYFPGTFDCAPESETEVEALLTLDEEDILLEKAEWNMLLARMEMALEEEYANVE